MFMLFLINSMLSLMKLSLSVSIMSMLICLEMMMSGIIMLILTLNINLMTEPYNLIIILSVMVCEGSIGLSVVSTLSSMESENSFKLMEISKMCWIGSN